MPRQNRRRDESPRRGAAAPVQHYDVWRGDEYVVRQLSGGASGKGYRCPGCDQEIQAGLPHVVTWRADDPDAGDRRHWHTACWAARDRRAPSVQRGRNAPRH